MIQVDEKGGLVLFSVRVSPGAAKTRILGEHAGVLKVAVAAPPEKGKANRELAAFLAGALGVSRRAVAVVAGQASRSKRVSVDGVSMATLGEKLARLADA